MASEQPHPTRKQLDKVVKQVTSAAEVIDATPGRRTLRSNNPSEFYELGAVSRAPKPLVHSTPACNPANRDKPTPHTVTCGQLIPSQYRAGISPIASRLHQFDSPKKTKKTRRSIAAAKRQRSRVTQPLLPTTHSSAQRRRRDLQGRQKN